jgi:Ca-activated chloride channel family protein
VTLKTSTTAVLLAAYGLTVLPSSAATAPPSFSSSVEMVHVDVSVTGGDRSKGLGADDFVVLENGVPQRIALFRDTGRPLSLVLLLDVSASMAEDIELVRRGACTLVDGLRWGDVARVVAFNERAAVAQDYTSDRGQLKKAVLEARGDGQTALYTTLYVTLKDAARVAAGDRSRRHAVVLFSDGADTLSRVTDDQVLAQAGVADVPLYTVYLGDIVKSEPAEPERARYVMEGLAGRSGGRAFFPRAADEIPRLSQRLAGELHTQYGLGYVPAHDDAGGWRQILVLVRRSGVEVRHRLGYYAGAR